MILPIQQNELVSGRVIRTRIERSTDCHCGSLICSYSAQVSEAVEWEGGHESVLERRYGAGNLLRRSMVEPERAIAELEMTGTTPKVPAHSLLSMHQNLSKISRASNMSLIISALQNI